MFDVCVLMSTYNGAQYISEQIETILCQENVSIKLVIRDDGSTDETLEIINKYIEEKDNVYAPEELTGYHSISVGASFMSLLRYAVEHFDECNYFAFADQDDVWYKEKLSRGVAKLSQEKEQSLYFSKKTIVDNSLHRIKEDTVLFNGDFSDYLMHNYASGCTMIINRKFAEFSLIGNPDQLPYLHDSYLFRLASCTETRIIYDTFESMMYRQHENNVVGAQGKRLLNKDVFSKIIRNRRHYLRSMSRLFLESYGLEVKERGYSYLLGNVAGLYSIISSTLLMAYIAGCKRSIHEKVYMMGMVLTHGY